eukprot:gnl/Carplike_NY0171/3370_a4535_427.p1 GENE.gnl/Carplike_NY0171/3370_a4535_427~~gnl/Carplike_NY0171/3370_a4535_427.p1  ORF type:complete len:355 (+),score=104.49 gnl/Carplike_NY0171/3370_a4535_427:415-1479(+)
MKSDKILEVLGVHTVIPHIVNNWDDVKDIFKDCPLVTLNRGKIPPYIIACGDRNRVEYISGLLDEGTAVLLNERMKAHGKPAGRVAVALGTYKGVPVAVFEHLMGTPSVEILVKEVTSPEYCAVHEPYKVPTTVFRPPEVVHLVRVGSCGGVNSPDSPELSVVQCGDIIIMNKVIGVTGCDIQSITGSLDLLSTKTVEKARATLLDLGFEEEGDDKILVKKSDPGVSSKLSAGAVAARAKLVKDFPVDPEHKFTSHVLGYTSKDSLYCESNEEEFMALRKDHGVACSEMEASCLVRLSAQREVSSAPLRAGAVCGVIGAIPGESFCSDRSVIKSAVTWACYTGLEGVCGFAKML